MTREQTAIKKRAQEAARAIKKAKGMKKAERDAEAAKALRAAEQDIEALEIRKTGNPIPKDATCFVCGKAIRTGAYRTIGWKGGEPYMRHDACAPGTESWKKSDLGRKSSYLRYFEAKPEPKGGDIVEA